jgi:biotin transport system substrate-specific component
MHATTLADAVWTQPDDRVRRAVRATTLVLGGSLVIALAAQLVIPFWPVPFTMQTFAVLLLAAVYGRTLGTATVLVYLAQGAAGLGVFAGFSGGLAVLGGPTAGYLWGFVAAAFVVGALAERGWGRSVPRVLAAMTVGTVVVFAPGVAWLARYVGTDPALQVGLVNFALSEPAKVVLAASLVPAAWRTVERAGR